MIVRYLVFVLLFCRFLSIIEKLDILSFYLFDFSKRKDGGEKYEQ